MKRITPLVALALTGLFTACGDDNGDTAPQGGGGETLAPEQFAAEASNICASVNQDLASVSGREFQTEGASIIAGGLSDLEGLPPPSGEEKTFVLFIQAGREALDRLETATEPPREDLFDDFTRLGNELGIEGGCTEAGQGGG